MESSCMQYLQNKMTVAMTSRPPTTPDTSTMVARYGGRPDVVLLASEAYATSTPSAAQL